MKLIALLLFAALLLSCTKPDSPGNIKTGDAEAVFGNKEGQQIPRVLIENSNLWNKTYFRELPNYTCTLPDGTQVKSHESSLKFIHEGSEYRIEESGNACAPTQELAQNLEAIEVGYQEATIGLKDRILVSVSTVNNPISEYTEMWCPIPESDLAAYGFAGWKMELGVKTAANGSFTSTNYQTEPNEATVAYPVPRTVRWNLGQHRIFNLFGLIGGVGPEYLAITINIDFSQGLNASGKYPSVITYLPFSANPIVMSTQCRAVQ